jgi:hypothetical protein
VTRVEEHVVRQRKATAHAEREPLVQKHLTPWIHGYRVCAACLCWRPEHQLAVRPGALESDPELRCRDADWCLQNTPKLEKENP